MKKAFFFGTLFLFLASSIQSNAEMKITPSGIASADNSAVIHLSGSSSTEVTTNYPDGAVISGVNEYTGLLFTCGGYFEASGTLGMGVYGTATGTTGSGVYGTATGTTGSGVYGVASGTSGKAVYGYATNNGEAINYGGYFQSVGVSGIGVYGKATGFIGKGVNASATGLYGTGVYASATGFNGWGVYASASGGDAIAVYGTATGDRGIAFEGTASGDNGKAVWGVAVGDHSVGVYGSGTLYDFYAAGQKSNFGPFTGAHEVKFSEDMPEEIVPGLIVSVNGKTAARMDQDNNISLSSTLPTVTLSTKPRDKAVFGVVVSDGPLTEDHWYKTEDRERFGVVNALGEGRVWVTDINGEIQAGDYITTSSVCGYGQMQDDDLLHSYTLGKAIETIDWEQVMEKVQHDGKTYKRYLIAVVYTSG